MIRFRLSLCQNSDKMTLSFLYQPALDRFICYVFFKYNEKFVMQTFLKTTFVKPVEKLSYYNDN